MLSLFSSLSLGLISSALAVEVTMPIGKISVKRELWATSTGILWLVEDEQKTEFTLKTFAIVEGDKGPLNNARFVEFLNEGSTLTNLTSSICPEKSSTSLKCSDVAVEPLLLTDVMVFNGSSTPLVQYDLKLELPYFKGSLAVDFRHNFLFPYVSGQARLAEVLEINPEFDSLANRFGVFATIVPQLTSALRFLHANHLVHLDVSAENVLCLDKWCSKIRLSGFGKVWGGEGAAPVAAHEIFQQSVDSKAVFELTKLDKETATARVNELLSKDKTDFSGVRSVDWFGLGATLFYTLTKSRPPIEGIVGSGGAPKISESFLSFFDENQAEGFDEKLPVIEQGLIIKSAPASSENARKILFEIIRNKVIDGVLLIDGLLQLDRESRIDLDKLSNRLTVAVSDGKHLRASAVPVASVIQIDSFPTAGKSCSEFLNDAARNSAVFKEQGIVRNASPVSFLEGVC